MQGYMLRYQLDRTLDANNTSLSRCPSINPSEQSVTFVSTQGSTIKTRPPIKDQEAPRRATPPATISVITPILGNPPSNGPPKVHMPTFKPSSDECPGYGPPAARNTRPMDNPSDIHSIMSRSSASSSHARSRRSQPTTRHPFATNSSVSHHRHLDDYGATDDIRRYIPRNEIDHESFSDRTRILPRQALNVRVTWNGDALKWQQFKFNIEGWLYQSGLSYTLSPRFQRSYAKGGWPTARAYALPNICGKQFAHDQSVFYGALRTACRDCRPGARYFLEFCDPPDGLAVWLKFLGTFDHRDCLDTKIQVYQRQADAMWHTNFPGGLEGFLEHTANAHAQMDRADPTFLLHSKSTDYQLINTVKNRLAGYDSSGMIYSIADAHKDKTFDAFMLAILKWRNFEDAHHLTTAISKAKHTHTDPEVHDPTSAAFAAYGQPRGIYHMDSHSFNALKAVNPILAAQWVTERNNLLGNKPNPDLTQPPDNTPRLPSDNYPGKPKPVINPGLIPSQYNRTQANVAAIIPQAEIAEPSNALNATVDIPPPDTDPATAFIHAVQSSYPEHQWSDTLRQAYNTMLELQLSDEDSDSLTYAHHASSTTTNAHCQSRVFAGHAAVQLRPGWHFSTTDGGGRYHDSRNRLDLPRILP